LVVDKQFSLFAGDWRITEMEAWDKEYLDTEVPAYIRFEEDKMGRFQFGLVQGSLDCRTTTRDGRPAVEFSWDGSDEMDSVSGRGWAVVDEDGCLRGRIFIHGGDDSAFFAIRQHKQRKGSPKENKKSS
jgi:hypothetical protein